MSPIVFLVITVFGKIGKVWVMKLGNFVWLLMKETNVTCYLV